MSQLASQGYQILSNVLSADEISGMRAAITETIDRVASALRAPISMSCPEALFEDRIEQIAAQDRGYGFAIFRAVMADAQRDPRIEVIVDHPTLTANLSELLAPLTRTGQVIRPRASVAAFSKASHPWHQDVVRPSNTGCGSVRVACWIPLTEVDERSGSLEMIPGAWREPLPHEVRGDGVFGIKEDYLPQTERRRVPLKPGDVLVLDRFIPHRTLPVEHGKARWAVAMWVRAAEAA
jgi:ectoine hydroxylase-related dioxygenase (phytanoyl-CoA dioxygenase family)